MFLYNVDQHNIAKLNEYDSFHGCSLNIYILEIVILEKLGSGGETKPK